MPVEPMTTRTADALVPYRSGKPVPLPRPPSR